jgi:hypothetical protein
VNPHISTTLFNNNKHPFILVLSIPANDFIIVKICLGMYLFILQSWGLNSGLALARQAVYHMSHTPSPLGHV